MSNAEFSFLMQTLPGLSANQIAEVILNEHMTDRQTLEFNTAIPPELLSEVMARVE